MPEPRSRPLVTRRTVVRSAAWAVPVIAAAAAAPLAAASGETPPDPSFDWSTDCKSSGNSGKGCGTNKSYQVEVAVTNTSALPHILWFSDYTVAGSSTGTPTDLGISGVYEKGTASNCGAQIPDPTACAGSLPATGHGILVPAGASVDVWAVSDPDTSSGGTFHTVTWEWINAVTCEVDASGTSESSGTELFPPCS